MPEGLTMMIVRRIFGATAISLWVIAALLLLFPPGDNADARALGEMLAAIPAFLALVVTVAWAIMLAVNYEAKPAP